MSSHGWANDSTWGVAGACDNTADFQQKQQPPILAVARRGDPTAAAAQLRTAVAEKHVLGGNLASWVDLGVVDWRELVVSWAADDE